MSKSISKILIVTVVLLSTLDGFAQIKNVKTETVKISGSCEMSKTSIEKAGNLKNIAIVEWDKDSKMAILHYDSKKTNRDEILKRIALAGYDNEQFLAPDDIYAQMPEACKYNRALKPSVKEVKNGIDIKNEHANHSPTQMAPGNNQKAQNTNQLMAVFEAYFSVKDALVKTDAQIASIKSNELIKTVNAVEQTKLSPEELSIWMKIMKDLIANAEKIAMIQDVSRQREVFALLSENIYNLAKVSKLEGIIYYQHCPMYNTGKGANWLSKDPAISNPYYGAKMLSCGSTVETLNKNH